MARYLYSELALAIQARLSCKQINNDEWARKWGEAITLAEENFLPSGSGIDSGCKIDLDRSHGSKIVMTFGYLHMDESGYTNWTEYTAYVTPSFQGVSLRITGPNQNDIKDYLYQTFDYALQQRVELIPLPDAWQKRMDEVKAELQQTLTLFAAANLPMPPNKDYYRQYWAPEQAEVLAESLKQSLREDKSI